MDKKISKKHLNFIKAVADGDVQYKAYLVSIGKKNISKSTAAVKSSQLVKKYAKEIAIERAKNKAIADKASKEAIASASDRKILSSAERMEILTQIAQGGIPLKKHMIVDKVIEEVTVVPDWMDRKNAIAELNKMTGDYTPIKTDITTGGEKIATNFYLPKEDEQDND